MDIVKVKLCIICGVEEDGDKEGDCGTVFSKDVKLGKFCGELELSSVGLSLNGEGEFTAFNFLRQLDECSGFVRVCGDCSGLISETVDKRGRLEEVECQVLELQIKLLVKLKELEDCSMLYLGEMGRIKEKVKGGELNGLERNIFGKGKGKCDVLDFRERILNVATSLAIFQDKLAEKLFKKPLRVPVEAEQREGYSPLDSESHLDYLEEEDDNFSDKLSLSPASSPEPEVDVFNDAQDDKYVKTLEEIKLEIPTDPQDNLSKQPMKETKLEENEKDKHTPIKVLSRRKKSKLLKQKTSQVQWSSMGPLKTVLIKNILIGHNPRNPDTLLSKYKWTYSAPADQLKYADHPIQITEVDLIGEDRRLTLSCNDNHDDDNPCYEISFNFPTDHKTGKGISVLKRKFGDHVLSFHLNAFKCPKCPKAQEKIKSLKIFRAHMESHRNSNICDICGRNFSTRPNMLRHQKVHKGQEDLDKLKIFQCSVCGKGFATTTECNIHEDQHKPKELREKVTCSFCGKEILKRCYLMHKKHYCKQQTRNTQMDCEICGKSFKNGKYLGDHLMRKHKMKERPKF